MTYNVLMGTLNPTHSLTRPDNIQQCGLVSVKKKACVLASMDGGK